MKTKYLYAILFLSCASLNAQTKKAITKDSLMSFFKTMPIFDALDKIYKTNYYSIDYDNLRNDAELKSYFLKCLDQNKYFEYEKQQDDKRFLEQLDTEPEFLKNEIRYYFNERKREKEIDSILKSPELISKFKDSVVFYRKILYRSNKVIENYYPRLDVLVYFRYPEVYSFIKKIYQRRKDEKLFDFLLYYNDPDAQKEYDLEIEKGIHGGYLDRGFGIAFEFKTSFGLKTAKKLLFVDREIAFDSDGYETPYNCELAGSIMYLFRDNQIKLSDGFKKEFLRSEELHQKNGFTREWFNNKCLIFKKYRPEILLHLDEIINVKIKKEEKWMKDMPFYKKK